MILQTFPSKALFITLVCILLSCDPSQQQEISIVEQDQYHILKPKDEPRAVLVLFGGFPENATAIRKEFPIASKAYEANVSVIYMNYSQRIWLSDSEKNALASMLLEILHKEEVSDLPTFIGGFSSGGNMAFLVGSFLIENKLRELEGVFLIDSPIDLVGLYNSSIKAVNQSSSEKPGSQESLWLLDTLKSTFGDPKEGIASYEKASVYLSETSNTSNLQALKHTKIRLYTEPDFSWWAENRGFAEDQTNAFFIRKLANQLKYDWPTSNVQLIQTTGKGYRSDGSRHPHSWSIVDQVDLLKWMLSDLD